MTNLYRLYFILLIFCLSVSCKKEADIVVIDPKATSSIQLKVDNVINDSTIVLKWSKYPNSNFKNYTLFRSAKILTNGAFTYSTAAIKTFTSADSLQYTENKMPFARDITYSLSVVSDSLKTIAGAIVNYVRPNTLYQMQLVDVLFNDQKKYLYACDAIGHILLIDYASKKQIASTDLKVGIGFCTLGDYQGSKNELYVPTYDGWLYILDAFTLQTKDKIYVTGKYVTSVVANNGQLFVSSTDASQTINGYDNQMKVYDRSTKAVLSRTGFWNETRLLYLKGTNTEIVDLTLNLSPGDVNYYKFNAAGVLQSKTPDPTFNQYRYDSNVFRSFPDGKFITGADGYIFNKNLVYDRTVKTNGYFSDFTFNADGSTIYAASVNTVSSTSTAQPAIQAFAYPSLNILKTYKTVLSPFKVFLDGSTLIVISTDGYYHPTYFSSGSATFMIEKINL